jgi:DNA-binding transcriptional LysR family regulator
MIDRLEMFLALARERHFGRAAESLGVAQPTLSAAIKALEESLGVVLVRRGSRFMGLTEEGERALVWARRMVADARSLREEMRARQGTGGLGGHLRLGVIPTALGPASRLTAALTARHAGVRVTVTSATSAAILDGIEALALDAGITYLDNEPLGRARAVALHQERYAAILRDDHPLAGEAALPWAALADLPLCLLTPDMQNRRIVARHLQEAGLPATPRVEANSITVLVAHVLAGGFATVLPLGAAELFLAHGPLVAVPLAEPDARHEVGLVVPARDPQLPVVEALLAIAGRLSR